MVQEQPRICPVERDVQIILGFWDTNRFPNLEQKSRTYNNQQKKKKKKKRSCRIVDFDVPADHWLKLKECKKRDKYLDLSRELKKLWDMKVTIIPIVIGALSSYQMIGTMTGGLGNNGTGGDCTNYSIVAFGLNTEKSPADLRRLAVTQTLVENHQLTLMWKTVKE